VTATSTEWAEWVQQVFPKLAKPGFQSYDGVAWYMIITCYGAVALHWLATKCYIIIHQITDICKCFKELFSAFFFSLSGCQNMTDVTCSYQRVEHFFFRVAEWSRGNWGWWSSSRGKGKLTKSTNAFCFLYRVRVELCTQTISRSLSCKTLASCFGFPRHFWRFCLALCQLSFGCE